MADRYYYLGPWVWDTSEDAGFWRAPEGTVGLIDLRPASDPHALSLFVCEKQLGADYRLFGKRLEDSLAPSERAVWRSALRIGGPLAGPTLRDLIWQTLLLGSDPEGAALCPPLVPTHRGLYEIHLAGERIWSRPFAGMADPGWPLLQRLMQGLYGARKQEAARSGSDLHRKWLAAIVAKLGVPWQAIGDEEPRRPDTTVSDNFNRADDDSLGANWSEVSGDWDILSNALRCAANGGSGYGTARFESDLSSDDMYSQAICTGYGGSRQAGVTVRVASDAETCYSFEVRNNETTTYRIRRLTAGTSLGAVNTTHPSVPFTAKLTVDGSSLEGFIDGSSVIGPITDTNITGNTRAGTYANSANNVTLDDFQAADLVAASGPPVLGDRTGGKSNPFFGDRTGGK